MKEIIAILGLKAKATSAEAVEAIKALIEKIKFLESAEAVKSITEAKEAAENLVHELEGKLGEATDSIANLEGKLTSIVNNLAKPAEAKLSDEEIDGIAKKFMSANEDIKELWVTGDGEIYINKEMAMRHASSLRLPQPKHFTA
jgi:predicted  nucleic acid-binding Zn-ribbon protein